MKIVKIEYYEWKDKVSSGIDRNIKKILLWIGVRKKEEIGCRHVERVKLINLFNKKR